ncbi:hypothetical protein DLM77_14810 [Leptospira yasudae]|uniref:Uncharacterized protein n=1 Tax=Leptospira yasudae TaxID=2202201 RepID=A0ABX9M1M5_9LEPT|nr:hypothetical protein DLM77_14810 [Leptospira yasudae]
MKKACPFIQIRYGVSQNFQRNSTELLFIRFLQRISSYASKGSIQNTTSIFSLDLHKNLLQRKREPITPYESFDEDRTWQLDLSNKVNRGFWRPVKKKPVEVQPALGWFASFWIERCKAAFRVRDLRVMING